jgi:hypothetical protein
MTFSSTPEGTGHTVADAANAFEALLADEGHSDGDEGEREEETPSSEDEADLDDDGGDAGDDDEAEDLEESDDDEDGPEGEEEQPELHTIKIDGEEVQVTLEEALKGYQREKDYTRKTQALAGERKALTDSQAAHAAERTRTKALLTALETRLAEPDDDIDMDALRISDPGEYAARVTERQERREIARAAAEERQRLEASEARERQQSNDQAAKEATGKLLEAIPTWSDPKVAEKDMKAIADYAKTIGYTDTDLSEVLDHRLFIMAREAAAYRALKAKAPQTRAKVEQVRTAKPGSTQTRTSAVSDVTRAKQRLAKTGREADAAALFMMLPD